MKTINLKINGVLFRIHFILINKAIIGVYTEEQIKELAKTLTDTIQTDEPEIMEAYRKEITKAVNGNYTADSLEKVILDLLSLTKEKREYKGIDEGDLGLLDSMLEIFYDMACNWMESRNCEVSDCGIRSSAMIRSIRNIFNDSKFGATMDLLVDMEILGRAYK